MSTSERVLSRDVFNSIISSPIVNVQYTLFANFGKGDVRIKLLGTWKNDGATLGNYNNQDYYLHLKKKYGRTIQKYNSINIPVGFSVRVWGGRHSGCILFPINNYYQPLKPYCLAWQEFEKTNRS